MVQVLGQAALPPHIDCQHAKWRRDGRGSRIGVAKERPERVRWLFIVDCFSASARCCSSSGPLAYEFCKPPGRKLEAKHQQSLHAPRDLSLSNIGISNSLTGNRYSSDATVPRKYTVHYYRDATLPLRYRKVDSGEIHLRYRNVRRCPIYRCRGSVPRSMA